MITGAGSGIGAGIARAAAANGMKVVVSDISLECASGVADDIVRNGGEAGAVATDVRDAAAME